MTDMTPLPPHDDLMRQARRRAGAKLGWYTHLCVYLVVNLGLYALSSEAWGYRHWSLGPVLGWGLGVVLHGVSVFVLRGSLRDRMVQRELERMQSRGPQP